jgi:hypothetical protein
VSGKLHAVDDLLSGECSGHPLVSRLGGPKCSSGGGSVKDVFSAFNGGYHIACCL